MAILLTVIVVLVFFGGAYCVGNLLMGTLHEGFQERFLGTGFGVLLWIIVGLVGGLVYLIYSVIDKVL